MKRLLLLLLLLLGTVDSALAVRPGGLAPGKGRLLVATEGMRDARFRRSVILLIDYAPGGVAGIILNQPTAYRLAEAVPQLADEVLGEAPLHYGGPMERRVLLTLIATPNPGDGAERVDDNLHLVTLEQLRQQLRRQPHLPFRVMSGYAGWAVRQLDAEIARGDWTVLPVPDKLLELPVEDLWQQLSQRRHDLWI